jgi:hypothetical protein
MESLACDKGKAGAGSTLPEKLTMDGIWIVVAEASRLSKRPEGWVQ